MLNKQQHSIHICLALVIGLFAIPQVHANNVGIGIGATPQFKGSSDYQAIPMASFSVDTRIGILASEQIGIKLDLIKSRAADTGPILQYQTGRSNDMSDNSVAKLPEIEASMEAGWFLSSGIPLSVLGLNSESIITAKISATTDLGDGHGGSQVSISSALVTPIGPEIRLITSLGVNFSDENYQQAFFGVSEIDSIASGIPAFDATGGLESTSLSLIVVKTINTKWSVTSISSLSLLQADVADSPITKRGKASQLFLGLIFTYQL